MRVNGWPDGCGEQRWPTLNVQSDSSHPLMLKSGPRRSPSSIIGLMSEC